jgi:hypothetical protein
MEDTTEVTLTFKGLKHSLTKLLGKAGSCPVMAAEVRDINVSEEALALVSQSADVPGPQRGSILFYKHEGKFIVLRGIEQVQRAIAAGRDQITGHLVSGPTLKAARIEEWDNGTSVPPIAVELERDRKFSNYSSPSRYPSQPRKWSNDQTRR